MRALSWPGYLPLASLLATGCALLDSSDGEDAPPLYPQREDHEVPGVQAVAIADATGDGIGDVLIADDGTRLAAFVNGQRRELAAPPFSLTGLHTADLNGDGTTDLVGSGGKQLLIILDLDRPVYTAHTSELDDPLGIRKIVDVAIGDVNDDALADLVIASNEGLFVLYQDASGGGAFSGAAVELPLAGSSFNDRATRVAVADGDGDGRNDLLLLQPNQTPARIALMRQVGTAQFGAPQTFAAIDETNDRFQALLAVDLGGSGRSDIVAVHSGSAEVFIMTQGMSFESRLLATSGDSLGALVAAGDVDGDHRVDLVLAHGFEKQMLVFRQQAPLAFSATALPKLPGEPTGLAVGDVDGDVGADLAVIGVGKLSVFHGSAATSARATKSRRSAKLGGLAESGVDAK